MAQFFFDMGGTWIAFRRHEDDKYLFDASGQWIGWFPWGDDDAVDTQGQYLGTIVRNRLVRFHARPYRGYPGYPGYAGYAGYIPGASDIERLKA